MLIVETIARIRREHFIKGKTIKEIARDLKVSSGVGQAADPQTDAAIKLIAWISGGIMRPGPEDFSMLRLILFALLPQIGGLLLLVGRSKYRL
jgi:hypothetical protein